MSLLIRKVTLLDPRSDFHNKTVDVLWGDGEIQKIAPEIQVDAQQIIEFQGAYISAGWIDIFADYCEPGYEQKETIATGLQAAAAGGFTEVFTVPNTFPTVSNKSAVQYLLQKSKAHVVSLHPLGAISQEIEGKSLAEMHDMYAYGAIAFSDGWKPLQHPGLMLKALEYIKAFNGILIQMPIDQALASGGLMNEGIRSTQLGMPGVPILAETLMIHRDIELLRYTGSRLHITGVSTAEGVQMIREAKKEGLHITCSVTPYHLYFTDEALQTYDSLFKVAPVLRSEKDREALMAGLADGTIDCITSHHRPQDKDAKDKEFAYAADGMNLQEITYAVANSATSGKVPFERIIDALSITPAKIFKGGDSPKIEEKYKGGLTIFTKEDTYVLEEKNIFSASTNNPFLQHTLKGRVIGIINKGQIHLNT